MIPTLHQKSIGLLVLFLRIFMLLASHNLRSFISDYFDEISEYERTLIKKGLAYVDNTDRDTIRKQGSYKIESACRSFSLDKNLEIYQKMLKGEADEYCLRAKIDMNSRNGCLKDPVLGRANRTPHQRSGKKIFHPIQPTISPVPSLTNSKKSGVLGTGGWLCDKLENW